MNQRKFHSIAENILFRKVNTDVVAERRQQVFFSLCFESKSRKSEAVVFADRKLVAELGFGAPKLQATMSYGQVMHGIRKSQAVVAL